MPTEGLLGRPSHFPTFDWHLSFWTVSREEPTQFCGTCPTKTEGKGCVRWPELPPMRGLPRRVRKRTRPSVGRDGDRLCCGSSPHNSAPLAWGFNHLGEFNA